MTNCKYYIYELLDPITKIPFYVGKGQNNRMYEHFNLIKNNKKHYNEEMNNILYELKLKNLEPIYNKIEENLTSIEANKYEIEWIKFYGLNNLCNLTAGGEGGNTLLSEEIRKKHSKGKGFKGKKHSEETKQRMRLAKLGKTYEDRFGIKKAIEIKNKISISTSGDKNGMFNTHRVGINAPHYGKIHTKQTKLRISKTKTGSQYKTEA